MMYLLVYFAGTGCDTEDFYAKSKHLFQRGNLFGIFISGCDSAHVCDSMFFPNLSAYADRFVSLIKRTDSDKITLNEEIFINNNNNQSINNNLAKFGIEHTIGTDQAINQPLEKIILCGYSRGGNLCFVLSKKLKQHYPDLKILIAANQPVPGNLFALPHTNVKNIIDCSALDNIEKVSIILGSYTGHSNQLQGFEKIYYPLYHRFFSQMVPQLSDQTEKNFIVIPNTTHHYYEIESQDRLIIEVEKFLVADKLVDSQSDHFNEKYRGLFNNNYWGDDNSCQYDINTPVFPPKKNLQSFFSKSHINLYQYLDSLHPQLNADRWAHDYRYFKQAPTSLLTLWKRQEQENSPKENKRTRELVSKMNIDITKIGDWEIFIKEASKWLLFEKNHPRYKKVEALRDFAMMVINDQDSLKSIPDLYLNICDYLINENIITQYWQEKIVPSSDWMSLDTKALNMFFEENQKKTLSSIIDELTKWLKNKKEKHSARKDKISFLCEYLKRLEKLSKSPKIEEENRNYFSITYRDYD